MVRAEDLSDSLVPFFKAGLEHGEQCLWVTSEPFGVEDAKAALRSAVPDLARYLRTDELLQGWITRKEQALAKGRAGLRLTGNTYWLEEANWKDFAAYEEAVNRTFHQHEIVGLCSYCLHRCDSTGILDVVRNHQFAVARREGSSAR